MECLPVVLELVMVWHASVKADLRLQKNTQQKYIQKRLAISDRLYFIRILRLQFARF